ncbi:MAG: hypothetical protein K9G60_10400, partial [Pseudolabrys sp.]|nr:hypothetical protein [Pseudolabrys sp.]
ADNSPERPRPKTATFWPAKVVIGIMGILRHAGARPFGRESGIHNHRPGLWIAGPPLRAVPE